MFDIRKGGIMLLELENHLNSKYQDVTNYVIKNHKQAIILLRKLINI